MCVGRKKDPHPGTLLLLLTLTHLTHQIDIETSEYTDPLQYDCDKVTFAQETYIRCTCLDGIWAVLIDDPIESKRHWKVYGVDKQCIHIGQWVTQVHKLSNSAIQSTLSILPLRQEAEEEEEETNDVMVRRKSENRTVQYVVTNTNNWQLTLMTDDGQREDLCLPAAGLSRYCTYKLLSTTLYDLVDEREMQGGEDCSKNSRKLYPVTCDDLLPPPATGGEEEPLVCNLIPPKENLVRRKRQEPAKPTPIPIVAEDMDENHISDPTKYVGQNSEFMTSIMQYVIQHVLQLSGLKPKDGPMTTILPVSNLLLKSITLMKKLCNPVKDEVWDIALGAFLKHQKNYHHLKEPYIGYAAYQRILHTLDTCIANSTPYVYQNNWHNNEGKESVITISNITNVICESETRSSTAAKWPINHYYQFKKITSPSYADPELHEPLIETVWKSFVTTHAHCFKYFSDYYNDHHTFTVSIMPFFTNQIQDEWFLDKNNQPVFNDEIAGNYTDSKIWYGGLIGNAAKLFRDLDNCYGAARGFYEINKHLEVFYSTPDRYPWLMIRPQKDETNKWARKKRSANSVPCPSDDKSGTLKNSTP